MPFAPSSPRRNSHTKPLKRPKMAALREADAAVIEALKGKLLDPNTSLPEKYRVLFSLRNIKGSDAHDALLTGALGATHAALGALGRPAACGVALS